MALYASRDRESGYTPLEEETRLSRHAHAEKTPEKIAKAKDRRERRAAKKAAIVCLEASFSAAVASDPGRVTCAGVYLSQKRAENLLTRPETGWLGQISRQTDTTILRTNANTLYLRGLPANLILAKTRIQGDIARLDPKTEPSP